MDVNEDYKPSNPILSEMLVATGLEGVDPKGTPWGAFYGKDSNLLVILDPGKGTTVHDHPGHIGGTLTSLGPVVESDGDFAGSLAYKCQATREKVRTEGHDVTVTLSPGGTFDLIYGSAALGDEGVIGGWYGCHNLNEDTPIALSIRMKS